VRSGRPGDRPLLGRGDDRDHPRTEGRGQLAGGAAEPSGGAVHQDRLALLEPRAPGEREVRRQVVQRQCGSLVEGQAVRQREDHAAVDRDALGEATGHRQGRHPVTRAEAAGGRPHHAGHLPSGDERQVGTPLVQAPRLQHVREGDTGALDVDEDLVRRGHGLRPLLDLHGIRPGERGDHGGTHGSR
jgi:hypothetical protein